MLVVNMVLFEDFESLDLFGPVEIFGKLECLNLLYLSRSGGLVKSAQGAEIMTVSCERFIPNEILLVPGGLGTRKLVEDEIFLRKIQDMALASRWVLSVCTGSALLAKAGLLDGISATSNKRALNWVMEQGPEVSWSKTARWVHDGKFYTSSGVSAGTDMALAFVAEHWGSERAEAIATRIEYHWDPNYAGN